MRMRGVVGALLVGVVVIAASIGCGLSSSETTTTSSTTTISTTTTTTEPPASWNRLQPSGEAPSPRCYQAMVYDSTAGKVVMFAGFDGTSALRETWAYDPIGNIWTNLSPGGEGQPAGGAQIPAAYDPGSGKVITFDGTSWGYELLANTWAALNPQGQKIKPARLGASMAYDSAERKVYYFGGTDMANWYNELWAYDPAGNAWSKVEPTGELPAGRSDAGLAYDPRAGKLFLFGGIDSSFTCLNDLWAYDPVLGTWSELNPGGGVPGARSAHAMAYDPHSSTVVVFGGIATDFVCYSDVWAYDPGTDIWTELQPPGEVPAARGRSTFVYAGNIDKLILFGGLAFQQDTPDGFPAPVYFNDTWVYGVHR